MQSVLEGGTQQGGAEQSGSRGQARGLELRFGFLCDREVSCDTGRARSLEGSAQQGGAQQSCSRGQAGGYELAHSGVHGAVRRQAAGLCKQLSKQVEALCTRSSCVT